HQKMVYSVARGMLGDAHLAEDLAQDAFLHAYRALSSYRAQGKFPAWLRMIVTRLCLNYRRDTRREVAWDDLSGHPAELTDGPDSRVVEWERRGAVQRAIDSLPEDYRDVIVLRFMDDLTYEEIARHLGAPESLHARVMRRIPAPAAGASVRSRVRWPQGWPSIALVPIGAVAAWLFWAAHPALKAPLPPRNPATAPAVAAFTAPLRAG